MGQRKNTLLAEVHTMKLDRNINPNGRGKYALLKLRELGDLSRDEIVMALENLEELSVAQCERAVDFGDTPDSEFFVIRLKDRFAGPAIMAYAEAVRDYALGALPIETQLELAEYASEVRGLAERAVSHSNKSTPT